MKTAFPTATERSPERDIGRTRHGTSNAKRTVPYPISINGERELVHIVAGIWACLAHLINTWKQPDREWWSAVLQPLAYRLRHRSLEDGPPHGHRSKPREKLCNKQSLWADPCITLRANGIELTETTG